MSTGFPRRTRVFRGARAATVLWLAAGSSACVDATTVTLAHPLTHDALGPNRNARADTARADYLGVPENTFIDEATITELTPERACFQLVLRVDGEHIPLATPANWRVYLRGTPPVPTRAPAFGPPAPQTLDVIPGSIAREVFMGYSSNCIPAGRMLSCSPSPRYSTVRDPVRVSVITGAGAVCFDNAGAITPGTREITLHLDDPADVTRRLAFRWQLLP